MIRSCPKAVRHQRITILPAFLRPGRGDKKNKQIWLSDVVEDGLDRIERFLTIERFKHRSPSKTVYSLQSLGEHHGGHRVSVQEEPEEDGPCTVLIGRIGRSRDGTSAAAGANDAVAGEPLHLLAGV